MRLFLCALSTRSAVSAARLAYYDHDGALRAGKSAFVQRQPMLEMGFRTHLRVASRRPNAVHDITHLPNVAEAKKSFLDNRCSITTPCPGKKSLRFTIDNFNKFKYIFTLFGKNHPETPLYLNIGKFSPYIGISLRDIRSADVTVKSLTCHFQCILVNNVLYNNFNKFRRIINFW